MVELGRILCFYNFKTSEALSSKFNKIILDKAKSDGALLARCSSVVASRSYYSFIKLSHRTSLNYPG